MVKKGIKERYVEFRDNLNENLNPFMNLMYQNRYSIIILGFCLFCFPFISIFLGKYNKNFYQISFMNFEDWQITWTMIIGIMLMYAGLILFGYKKEKIGDFFLFTMKIALTFISIMILLGVDMENPRYEFLIFLYRTSYIWMLFLFLDESVKVLLKIFKAFNNLEVSTKITIMLPIIAAIISYVFKIEFNFK